MFRPPLHSRVNNSWIELSKRKSSNEQVIFLRFLSRWLNLITNQWPSAAAFPHRKPRAHWSSRSIDYQFLNEKKSIDSNEKCSSPIKKKQLRSTQIDYIPIHKPANVFFFWISFISMLDSRSLVTNFRTSRVKTHSNLGDEYIESFDREMIAV